MKPTLSQLQRLVGNPDAYALQKSDGSYQCVRKPLTPQVLMDHLAYRHTVGTYVGHNRDVTVARTLVFDIDSQDGDAPEQRVIKALDELGIPEWCVGLEDSGSTEGYHVWVVLQDYVPNPSLRRFGRAVCALADWQGEVFPKQDEVKDLGSLVKLPGGMHQVEHRPNDFEGEVPRPLPVALWVQALSQLPPEQQARRSASESRFPCMEAIQAEGCQEGSRNNQLYHLSAMLRRAGVSRDNVELIVRRTNELGDPLEEWELALLIDSTGGPLCDQVPAERHCGELCIRERMSGLYSRPGQLRFAADGENVVVTVDHRAPGRVVLTHDDAKTIEAVLRDG